MRTLARRILPVLVLSGLLVATAGQSAIAVPRGPRPTNYIGLAKRLSKPRFPQTIEEVFTVEAFDGEDLYVEVTRPDPAAYGQAPRPVILEASPYHGTIADREGTRMFPDPQDAEGNKIGITGYFAPRGYAVAMLDLRGTGRSTGCLDHLGQKDARDLKTVIEWLAAQPWSNGRVGMTGHSYVGSTPSVAASQAPEGLVTIVPSAGLASMYDHQFQSGVPYNLQWAGPMYAYEALAIDRDLPSEAGSDPATGAPFGDNSDHFPNPQFGCGLQNSAVTAGTGQVTGQYQLWHAQRDWSEGAAEAEIPVFIIHGVNDNAARIPAAEWFFANRIARPGDKVWLGQWDHGSTNGRCGNAAGARVLHPTCRFDQMKYAIHAWFDHHLMQREVPTGPPVEVFLNGRTPINVTQVVDPESVEGPVYTAKAWDQAKRVGLYPDATDGSLSFIPPEADGSATFGTTAQAVLASVGQGTLRFASEPLAGDQLFVGTPRLQLNASLSTGQITHLTATLYRETVTGVDEEGNEIVAREPMNFCAIQPQLRFGVQQVAPVIPGEEMALPLQCFTMAHWVPKGQRLALEISTRTPHHATFGSSDQNITVYTGDDKTAYGLPKIDNVGLHRDAPLHETKVVAGPAQPTITGTVTPASPGGGQRGGPGSGYLEFDILGEYDNASLEVLAEPGTPADVDLYLQEQAADGSWADAQFQGGGAFDPAQETLTAEGLEPGHYRVEVHLYAGAPATAVDVAITFFNQLGEPGP